MANHITVTASADGLNGGELRAALSELDVSQSSPVDPAGNRIGTAVEDGTVTLRATGDAEFTKKSQQALKRALRGLDAVDNDTVSVEAGGYEPADSEGEDSEEGE